MSVKHARSASHSQVLWNDFSSLNRGINLWLRWHRIERHWLGLRQKTSMWSLHRRIETERIKIAVTFNRQMRGTRAEGTKVP